MTDRMNREQASALVELVRTVRPAWDAKATLAALAEVRDRGDVAFVAYRVLKVALRLECATPRAIVWQEHWTEPDALRTVQAPQPPRVKPAEFNPDHPTPPDRAAEYLARLREIAATATRPTVKEDS